MGQFRSVLVANRGEIAVRIFRTVRASGRRCIAVYSDADAGARHVAAADTAMRIGPAPALASYLDVDAVLAAADRAGAEAVHPGYGFLSERADFARAVLDAGLVWIGPPPAAIAAMGDKIAAKARVAAAGVPVVPGRGEPGLDDGALMDAAVEIGFPVLLKPSAGGGGKGMRRVDDEADLAAQIAAARREASAAFGDDTILVERWVQRPRHIEVQVLADAYGHIVHLGERECSLQRRHQKIVEEAPSPLLDGDTRRRLSQAALNAAAAVDYVGAGTVEFIVSTDHPEDFFFLEMNTRLQVEHPVTEAVWGLDLVDWQLRIAAGARLPWAAGQLAPAGHAMEARIYAEDPERDFLPARGLVQAYQEPVGEGIRVDSSLYEGAGVGSDYDPMLAKVIAWGADREEARGRLRLALSEFVVQGLTTNTGFLGALLDHPDVIAGDLDTGLVERAASDLTPGAHHRSAAAIAAALAWALDAEPAGGDGRCLLDPWDVPGGWRVGRADPVQLDFDVEGSRMSLSLAGRASSATVVLGDAPERLVRAWWVGTPGRELMAVVDGVSVRWTVSGDRDDRWLSGDGHTWRIRRYLPGTADRAQGAGGPVTSPMPGTVLAVAVAVGDEVTVGSPLVVVEAMKMEYTVAATVAGVVSGLRVVVGQSVARDEVLATVGPAGPSREAVTDRPPPPVAS